ncbi:hypothetical protein AMTRI_Chr04g182050 [Amborella trichopoda]
MDDFPQNESCWLIRFCCFFLCEYSLSLSQLQTRILNQIQPPTPPYPSLNYVELGWLHKKLWNLLMEASVVEIIIQQVAATFVLLHVI